MGNSVQPIEMDTKDHINSVLTIILPYLPRYDPDHDDDFTFQLERKEHSERKEYLDAFRCLNIQSHLITSRKSCISLNGRSEPRTIIDIWSKLKNVASSESKFKSFSIFNKSDIDILIDAENYNVTFERVIVNSMPHPPIGPFQDWESLNLIPKNNLLDITITTPDTIALLSKFKDRFRSIKVEDEYEWGEEEEGDEEPNGYVPFMLASIVG